MPDPWIGRAYDRSRLLLLGESTSAGSAEDGTPRPPSAQHITRLVQESIESFPTLSFYNTLTRGLTAKADPTQKERDDAWSRVAFVGFVPDGAGPGARARPGGQNWGTARRLLRPVLENLQPRTVLVLGKDLWAERPETDLPVTDDVQGYRLPDGSTVMFWAISHPSRGLVWTRLAQVVAFATERRCLYLQ